MALQNLRYRRNTPRAARNGVLSMDSLEKLHILWAEMDLRPRSREVWDYLDLVLTELVEDEVQS